MSEKTDYKQINRASWDERTGIHYKSAFYDNEGFIKGRNSLNAIELEMLGDVRGKTVLHLQCHFGQDTISLGRMGARATGVDISGRAIDKARELASVTGTDCSFIRSDIYELPQQLDETFDLVFSSYGAIAWLPDMNRWARLIRRFLKPGGRFVLAEFHPVLWMFDDSFSRLAFSYFNRGPMVETGGATYTGEGSDIRGAYVTWNHSLGDVLGRLIQNGLPLSAFEEYDYSPYNCFENTVEVAPGKFRIKHLDDKIPMVFALSAVKQG